MQGKQLYRFGRFELDADLLVLYWNGEVVPLKPKALETLLVLVQNEGTVVSKDELLEEVWPDTFVEENSLSRNIHELRKELTLIEGGEYIETIPRRGYRFVQGVSFSGHPEHIPDTQTILGETFPQQWREAPKQIRWHFVAIALVGIFLLSSFTVWWEFSGSEGLSGVPSNKRNFKSIAILPLSPLESSEDDQILSLGLSDQLISRISGLGLFKVRPLSAVRKYTDAETDPLEVGAELGVDAVLTGTFLRNNGKIRINLRLLDVRDGAQVWARSFEEAEGDPLLLEEMVSVNVAQSLVDTLTVDETRRLKQRATDDPEAYKLFLEARFFADKRSEAGLVKSIELFKRASEIDPDFAEAYVGFADSNWLLTEGMRGYDSPNELVPRIRKSVTRALELDPNLAGAYTTLADIQMFHDWDRRAAEKNYRKALKLDPNLEKAHHWYAWLLMAEGRIDEAKREMRIAHELNPTSLVIATETGYPLFASKDYEEAVVQFRSATRLDDTYLDAHIALFRAFRELGDRAEMKSELERIKELTASDATVYVYCLGREQAFEGELAAAQEALNALIRKRESGQYVSPIYLAVLSLDTGRKSELFRWLEEGFRERNDFMPFLKITPEFEPIRDDPRFVDLSRRLDL